MPLRLLAANPGRRCGLIQEASVLFSFSAFWQDRTTCNLIGGKTERVFLPSIRQQPAILVVQESLVAPPPHRRSSLQPAWFKMTLASVCNGGAGRSREFLSSQI